ncbi:hypothetical protein GCM10011315_21640 [Roseovarius pacificus]|nr:hypothetical protein GCM10011315_21640 [Roseovarius pacificus]
MPSNDRDRAKFGFISTALASGLGRVESAPELIRFYSSFPPRERDVTGDRPERCTGKAGRKVSARNDPQITASVLHIAVSSERGIVVEALEGAAEAGVWPHRNKRFRRLKTDQRIARF